MVDLFVGEAEYRRKKFLKKLDELIRLYMHRQSGLDEYENKLLSDHKRLVRVCILLNLQ